MLEWGCGDEVINIGGVLCQFPSENLSTDYTKGL